MQEWTLSGPGSRPIAATAVDSTAGTQGGRTDQDGAEPPGGRAGVASGGPADNGRPPLCTPLRMSTSQHWEVFNKER